MKKGELLALLESVTGPECDRLALDMDHRCRDHSKWWKAVEKARKAMRADKAKVEEQ